MFRKLESYLCALIPCISLLIATAIPAQAGPTPVSGAISDNTTWTVGGSPYLVNGAVTINTGVVLTINPGVVVKFGSECRFDISGSLNAVGTSPEPIYFTDSRDDTVGGDTNADGSASAPAPGWWRGINIWDGGSATMDYCTVRYSLGYSIYQVGTWGGILKSGSGSLILTNSTVRDSAGAGVWLWNTTATVTISDCTLQNNASYGLSMDGTADTVTVTGNTITANTSGPVLIATDSSWVPVNDTNSLSGAITISGASLTPVYPVSPVYPVPPVYPVLPVAPVIS